MGECQFRALCRAVIFRNICHAIGEDEIRSAVTIVVTTHTAHFILIGVGERDSNRSLRAYSYLYGLQRRKIFINESGGPLTPAYLYTYEIYTAVKNLFQND